MEATSGGASSPKSEEIAFQQAAKSFSGRGGRRDVAAGAGAKVSQPQPCSGRRHGDLLDLKIRFPDGAPRNQGCTVTFAETKAPRARYPASLK